MKILIFLIVVTINSVLASSELASCEAEILKFGDGSGRDKISSQCINLYLAKALPLGIEESLDEKWKVVGFHNMLVIAKKDKSISERDLIAGSNTELSGIVAVTLDEAHQEIAVLLNSGDILFFSSRILGNVAPLRVIKSKELEGAVDLAINPNTNQVIVLNQKSQSLLFYSSKANIHAHTEKKNLGPKKIIQRLPAMAQSIAIHPVKKELYTLDSAKSTIWVYDLSSQKSLGQLVIPKNQLIKVEALKDELLFTDNKLDTIRIPRK
ncbi:MAG: hypothetical protein AB7I27_12615 [Bacteriovoracaceae bacterium]